MITPPVRRAPRWWELVLIFAVLFAIGVVLPGCTWIKHKDPLPQLAVKTVLVAYQCGEPPAADPFVALPVHWTATAQGFLLDPGAYVNLQTNLSRLLTSGQQVRDQRDFYKACIDRSQHPGSLSANSAPGPPAAKPVDP